MIMSTLMIVFMFLLVVSIVIGFVIFYIYMGVYEVLEDVYHKSCDDFIEINYNLSCPVVESQKYNRDVAAALFEICMITSRSQCDNYDAVPPKGFCDIHIISADDPITGVVTPYCLVFSSKRKAVICFTGSMTPGEWLSDLMVNQVTPHRLMHYKDGMLVHEGFYRTYVKLRTGIHEWLRLHASSMDIIYVTGHSLGGALSTLCILDMNISSSTILQHYTFGCPRVGNPVMAEVYNSLIHGNRIANTEDDVPALIEPFMGDYVYQHVNNLVTFTAQLNSVAKNHIDSYKYYLPKK